MGNNGVTLVTSKDGIGQSFSVRDGGFSSMRLMNAFDGARGMSAKSMRSKVESRMRKESGKTLREIRRAKKLRKKLMTDEERLIYNLRRAKKKAALLLQKLKKYELPELPPPRHDPELLTPEQMQAYKKIGFRNKNYVPVGVRGVFGGVVQNMHMHWKFHETVQVCCDNFPKEKIKEMASMLARLSGGIVVNIHNVKTIIMFRGRNYRQPKNLIPINTLTKRKALFKARFEQALDSQKLNIKKLEQELRRKGVNPEDPVAMASIQRVASTFFNAIDQKEGSPYVFQGNNNHSEVNVNNDLQQPQSDDDSDQEELDRFIAEIEESADKEWAEEEAAEKEELGRLKYFNREDFGGRFRRSEMGDANESDEEIRIHTRRSKILHDGGRKIVDSDDEAEDDEGWDADDAGDENIDESDGDEFNGANKRSSGHKIERWQQDDTGRANNNGGFKRETVINSKNKFSEEQLLSEDMLSDLDDVMFESDDEDVKKTKGLQSPNYTYQSSTDEEDQHGRERSNENIMGGIHHYHSGNDASEEDSASEEQDVQESWKPTRKNERGSLNNRKTKVDETWDSD
ncbi:RNA splicing factor [Lithospermum erythrorhizon]|uniref:RNA splicing factor n=1 Tax=Lithospermum erythrorhizon TaxID=34254 RepID=A0AAV3RKW9_LITER